MGVCQEVDDGADCGQLATPMRRQDRCRDCTHEPAWQDAKEFAAINACSGHRLRQGHDTKTCARSLQQHAGLVDPQPGPRLDNEFFADLTVQPPLACGQAAMDAVIIGQILRPAGRSMLLQAGIAARIIRSATMRGCTRPEADSGAAWLRTAMSILS